MSLASFTSFASFVSCKFRKFGHGSFIKFCTQKYLMNLPSSLSRYYMAYVSLRVCRFISAVFSLGMRYQSLFTSSEMLSKGKKIKCHQLLLWGLYNSPWLAIISMQVLSTGGDSSCSWLVVCVLGHYEVEEGVDCQGILLGGVKSKRKDTRLHT